MQELQMKLFLLFLIKLLQVLLHTHRRRMRKFTFVKVHTVSTQILLAIMLTSP